MKTIRNKTPKPLRVPLPGGKTLFLGPGKDGQISTKAVEHGPLKKLVEAGDIEILDDDWSGSSRPPGDDLKGKVR